MKVPITLLIIGLAAWTLAQLVSDRISWISLTPGAGVLFAIMGAFAALTIAHASK